MSRSRRKTPIFGFTTEPSEKQFKRQENRRERAAARSGREFVPTAYGPKDGKHWWVDAPHKAMRK